MPFAPFPAIRFAEDPPNDEPMTFDEDEKIRMPLAALPKDARPPVGTPIVFPMTVVVLAEPFSRMPLLPFAAITLVCTTALVVDEVMLTPWVSLPSGPAPAAFTPMRL